jgi:methylphosphotriester-DNA--protein-cysteine methyltransferase
MWRLIGSDGEAYESPCPGMFGGHRRTRIYGRLECTAARRALARGGYKADRVFFLDESAAIAAGYRPCAVCMSEAYARWRAAAPARR